MQLQRTLPSRYTEVAQLGQVHGLKGEINLHSDAGDFEAEKGDFLFVLLNDLYVPFEIETLRRRGQESWLVKFVDVDTAESAERLRNRSLWGDAEQWSVGTPEGDDTADVDPDALYAEDLIGFEAYGEDGRMIGTVVGYDDSTMNDLLLLKGADGREFGVPFVDDYIAGIDADSCRLDLVLPPGFLDIILNDR